MALARNGPINIPITLGVRFLENGTLFDPFSIQQVSIFNVATGGTALIAITPDAYGVGQYRVTWDALATSDSLAPGIYYDSWTWFGQSGMVSKTQRYRFELTAATVEPDPDPTPTPDEVVSVACVSKPSFIQRLGLRSIQDVGNGMGVSLEWEEARTVDFEQQIHYNIYSSDSRFTVLSDLTGALTEPTGVTTAQEAVVNIPPGNTYYFAVRATEFDTDIDITELTQISSGFYQYPTTQTLLNELPATEDGYSIEVADVSTFPSVGEVLIDTEIIRYTSVDIVNNELIVAINDRAITSTTLAAHEIGASVAFWTGIEDGNTIIRQGTADWFGPYPQNTSAIGQVNVDADGYRAANEDIITTDLSVSDTNTADFPMYDYTGYHKPSLQATFSGDCVGSYVGGEFNGQRGLNFQDRYLARLEAMLQITGENVVLLRRKWTGRRCRCISLRREHQRTRCDGCYGTSFFGGYDRFINTRSISESSTNTQGYIMIRTSPFIDDVKIESHQGLTQTSELKAWTLTFPTLKDRDILVRYNEGGTEEYRYEILDVTRNRLLFGQSAKQEFRILRLDKTDILYTFTIDTLV